MPISLQTLRTTYHSHPRKTVWISVLVSLSLANLCYLRVWDALLHNPERHYLVSEPHRRMDYAAALLGVLALTAGLYALIRVMWHSGNRWVRALAMLAVLMVFILPLDFVRRSSGAALEDLGGDSRYVIIGLVGLLVFSLAVSYRQRFYAALFWILALVSPYAAINIVDAVADLVVPEKSSIPEHLGPTPPRPTVAQRVVVIVFDEWDYEALRAQRHPALRTPVLDEVLAQSAVATHAFAPANMTRASIPAMLTGGLIAEARVQGGAGLLIRDPGDTKWRDFRESETLITDALRQGLKVAVLGWYHAYDRLFPRDANLLARTWGYPAFEGFRRETLIGSFVAQLGFLMWPSFGRWSSGELYRSLHSEALKAVADPAFDLVYLHYGIPHRPGIYDPRTGRLTSALSGGSSGYVGNLALVDRCLGELRQRISESGLGDATAIILTSDHWWRSAPWVRNGTGYRVPLIVRPARSEALATVDTPVCTTALRPLVAALLKGSLRSSQEIASFLHGRPLRGPVRYEKGILMPPAETSPAP